MVSHAPLPEPEPIAEIDPPTAEQFAALRSAGQPAVIRGLGNGWPAVLAARQDDSALIAYLTRETTGLPVSAIVAKPEEGSRFFYNADMTGFNFRSGKGHFVAFLADLMGLRDDSAPPAMAVQSTLTDGIMPHFASENALELLPDVPPRIWIGNRVRVAPHYDVKENIAVCVAGRRRFTLFAPDQIGNLYPGPFEKTPAGTPVSMIDIAEPNLNQYPNYCEAAANSFNATLSHGDGIYIPYCWWHGVESLDPVSCLVNYWWNDARTDLAGPYDALLHALAAYRHMPADQRAVWRIMLDHYVFNEDGDAAAHLPMDARGILGPPTPQLLRHMQQILRARD